MLTVDKLHCLKSCLMTKDIRTVSNCGLLSTARPQSQNTLVFSKTQKAQNNNIQNCVESISSRKIATQSTQY